MNLDRAAIERVVRQAVYDRFAAPKPNHAAPRLLVNISARHIHVTPQDLEILYGPGAQLTPFKALYQEGEFAANQTLTLIGPRQRIINDVRILGPCRNYSQVELSFTDGVSLGIDLPVRKSGDHRDTPGIYLQGPKGVLKLEQGVIRAERHVHVGDADCAYYGFKDGDTSTCGFKATVRPCWRIFWSGTAPNSSWRFTSTPTRGTPATSRKRLTLSWSSNSERKERR